MHTWGVFRSRNSRIQGREGGLAAQLGDAAGGLSRRGSRGLAPATAPWASPPSRRSSSSPVQTDQPPGAEEGLFAIPSACSRASPLSPGGRCRWGWLCFFSSALGACSGFLERHRCRGYWTLPARNPKAFLCQPWAPPSPPATQPPPARHPRPGVALGGLRLPGPAPSGAGQI